MPKKAKRGQCFNESKNVAIIQFTDLKNEFPGKFQYREKRKGGRNLHIEEPLLCRMSDLFRQSKTKQEATLKLKLKAIF